MLHLVDQLQLFLDGDSPTTVIHALATSRLDYCNMLCVRLPMHVVQKLVQNPVARMLKGSATWNTIVKISAQATHLLPDQAKGSCRGETKGVCQDFCSG